MDGSDLFGLLADISPSPVYPDARPLIVDSFAGGGGASTGIEMALGRSPDIAINHNAAALALHAANHPETLHLSENVFQIDPLDHLQGRHIGLMWFSPDCKHFSKAKGGKPVERNIRDLAWIIPGWIDRLQRKGGRVDVVIMENVEEWKDWGPLVQTSRGLMPCPDRRGETFRAWQKEIRRLGGKMQTRELRGCDYGAPTIRKRLFVIIRFDGRPIVWPAPTHGAPDSAEVMSGQRQPWRAAAECIDWSLPCPSIFDTSAVIQTKHGLRAKRPLAANTLARIARGMKRYVLDAERPFLVNLTHGGRVEDLADPLRTITGAHRGEKALVAPSLTRFNGGATGSDLRAPAPTITANSWIKRPGGAAPLGLLAPSLMSLKGTARRDSAVTAPHPTVLAGGGHSVLIAPVLTYAQQGGACRPATLPHSTICASRKDQNAAIIPTLIQTGYGERPGQAPRSLDLTKPLGTVVAGGIKHAVAAAFLAQQNGGPRRSASTGRDLKEPISTITGSGSQQTPVATFFAKYYGTGDGAWTDAPCHTITVKDRMAHVQAALQVPSFTEAHAPRAHAVAEFLRAHGVWDGGDVVTMEIDGATYVITDIGLRMLTPRELFNAQGFPPDYVIDGHWQETDGAWEFRPFTKDVQVSCCGNSVCPPLAEALVRANCAELSEAAKVPATQNTVVEGLNRH
ncbi:DNA cytosine methyltransferase [Pseudooceanicola spongiae]|uniref:DNA (cytosine-5-)-methyltransferase n=1 Tax=Pseudooceanicola spongiae TaxID=2613965 RepID=A0A7L9WI19_9RHOB|nr:DNA cytosine methyltransferase [Pseudooceanicola spongiae]QOL80045.1 DNA methyltransferase [Pseudooceanicola spongiae]